MVGSPEVNLFYLLTLTKKFDSAVRQGGKVLVSQASLTVRYEIEKD